MRVWATGATLHESGYTVACAMNAGNLKPVALALRAEYHSVEIIIASDDDRTTPGNPGRTAANAAAAAVGGLVTFPEWPADAPLNLTDFNDLSSLEPPPCARLRTTSSNLRPEAPTVEPERPCWGVYHHWVTNEKGRRLRPGGVTGTASNALLQIVKHSDDDKADRPITDEWIATPVTVAARTTNSDARQRRAASCAW